MIKSETVTMNDRQFTRTYSDAGKYIKRNETLYEEAIDPLGSGREYEETTEDIVKENIPVETRLDIVEKLEKTNSANIEYLAMMTETDLEV